MRVQLLLVSFSAQQSADRLLLFILLRSYHTCDRWLHISAIHQIKYFLQKIKNNNPNFTITTPYIEETKLI